MFLGCIFQGYHSIMDHKRGEGQGAPSYLSGTFWNSLWQQIGNSWKLLRTVVTKSFVLNVSGLLDPTLKCMPSIPSDIYLFKLSKKDTRTMCQLYLKLRISAPERCQGLLLLTLNMFCSLFYCYYYWTNKCRLGLRKFSFRQ